MYWIFWAETLVKFRNWSCLEIKCEKLREFLDTEWAASYCDTLQQAVSKFPVRLVDLEQRALICVVERLW
jgi:hypothetical protein